MKAIKAIHERHSFGCFTIEDINGDFYIVQLCFRLEELWQKNKKQTTLEN